jgi:hypothetical protein
MASRHEISMLNENIYDKLIGKDAERRLGPTARKEDLDRLQAQDKRQVITAIEDFFNLRYVELNRELAQPGVILSIHGVPLYAQDFCNCAVNEEDIRDVLWTRRGYGVKSTAQDKVPAASRLVTFSIPITQCFLRQLVMRNPNVADLVARRNLTEVIVVHTKDYDKFLVRFVGTTPLLCSDFSDSPDYPEGCLVFDGRWEALFNG